MCCCGSEQAVAIGDRHRLRIIYSGAVSVKVTGGATGSIYQFSGACRQALVDPRDIDMLADWRRFRLVGIVEANAPP